ncbi:MAG TPA: glycoside hydrolase family 2 TIM barrel-domain containing protein [Fimbriimonadaceae bacterium]
MWKWCLCVLMVPAFGTAQTQWQLPDNPLYTKWGKDVDPLHTLPEYPRPQMARTDWINLNGLWDFSLAPTKATQFAYDKKILVPFPVESALSGVKAKVDADSTVRYRREFIVPASWVGKRILLHFGAVDWQTTVKVNGKLAGTHKGGYDPFTFDITDLIQQTSNQTIEVEVQDPTDTSTEPRGKQVLNPGGIFYTSSTGIWQTVWLEPVPVQHIEDLKITPDFDRSLVAVRADVSHGDGLKLEASAYDGEDVVAQSESDADHTMILKIPHAKPWSPHSAFLYRLSVKLIPKDSKTPLDSVMSYFGLRKISVQKDNGINRIFLNGSPQFMIGTLDQGFWPDGIYTAPSDEALRSDLTTLKGLGFNVVRKHVKVEPDRWYYWCDKLGLLVWQDMPSGDRSIGPNDADIKRSADSAADFESELQAMVRTHENHPSIIMWVLFNEGWGQYDTARLTTWLKALDPTRLVDSDTGWADRGVGDVVDIHSYPGPASPKPGDKRAAVLGEFGGLGLPVPGHMWSQKGWSYQGFKTPDELTNGFLNLMVNLRPLIADPGLSAAIYTQTSDVETELNGLMSYDREVLKVNKDEVRTAVDALFGPAPQIAVVAPTAAEHATKWSYTTYQPDTEWAQPAYDDSKWATGNGGFGTKGTPGSIVGTTWDTGDIWIRRTFTVPKNFSWHNPELKLFHQDDAEFYIDGMQVAALAGSVTTYTNVPIKEGETLLKSGKHTLAVHCHKSSGGQFVDCGVVDVATP